MPNLKDPVQSRPIVWEFSGLGAWVGKTALYLRGTTGFCMTRAQNALLEVSAHAGPKMICSTCTWFDCH